MPNIYEFENIENFRDLGGYKASYGLTEPGIVFRSATPVYASKDEIDKIVSLGIKSVIDLREPKTKESLPSPFKGRPGINVIELNVNGNGRIPKDYDEQIETYFEMLEDPESARKIFKAILRSPKPLLMHCNAGKDRTGVFTAVLLLLNGVSMEEVNHDYCLSIDLLKKMAIEAKKNNLPSILWVKEEGFISDFFNRFLQRYISFENYFDLIGITEDEMVGLSNMLGKQELSCGAVVFNDGRILVEHMKAGHYSIPKGHKEPGNLSDEDTAKREIKEETGLLASIVPGFRVTTSYSPRPGRFKEVRWFIAETSSRELKIQPEEVQDAYWLKPEDAVMVLSHDDDRQVVEAACLYYLKD